MLMSSLSNISISARLSTKHNNSCQQQEGFILHDIFVFLYFRSHISKIYHIFTTWTKNRSKHHKRYVTTCFQIRSRIIISMVLGYVPGLYFLFLSYVAIFHLLWRWEGVGIYCKLIPYWIESTPARILFPTQYRTKLEIPLGELFRKYHRVIRKPDSLSLYDMVENVSRVFSTKFFTRP